MRILQVSSLWTPVATGGAELYAARLAAAQRTAGHTVGVVTLGVPGEDVIEEVPAWPYRTDQFSVQPQWKRAVRRVEDVYNPLAAARVRRAVRRFEPDVIHSHNVVGLSTAALTGASGRVPHVHHIHDYWLMCRRTTMTLPNGEPCHDASCRVIAAARNRIVRRHPPELLITPSQASIDAHAAIDWAKGRFRQLPYSVGLEYEGERSKRDAGAPVTFGYIGTVSAAKGVDVLLQAFHQLGGSHRLVVGGVGDLESEAAAAGPQVTALGWLGDAEKERFFSEIDCLVVPSRWPDTAPQVVPEARTHGVAVIGARIGGIPETVGARCVPLLFTPGDAGELHASLARFVAAPDDYLVAADGPRERIGLTWPDHVAAVGALYDEAIARAQAR